MLFRYATLDRHRDGTFSSAERLLVLGDVVTWRLLREHSARKTASRFPATGQDALGRLMLGPVEQSLNGQAWEQLSTGPAVAEPAIEPGPLRLASQLSAITTLSPPARHHPCFRVFANLDNAGELLLKLGVPDTRRIQKLLDSELPHLPKGKIPIFVQDGLSDLEALGWLSCLLTIEADRRSSRSQPSIVLTGSDGAGWHLVPLHLLASRKEVPEVALPAGLDHLEFVGWGKPITGPSVKMRDGRSACAVFKGEGTYEPAAFRSRMPSSSVLPLRLPERIRLRKRPPGMARRLWVVQLRELLTGDGRHAVEALVSPDPAALFAPVPPKDTMMPGGSYSVEIGEAASDVPEWTVPCRFLRLDSSFVPVVLSTIYSGLNQRGGVHFVPEKGSRALVEWTGRLSEHPVLTHLTRPAGERKSADQNGQHTSDVRKLGSAAVQLPQGRGLALDVPSLQAAAEGDVQLLSRKGQLRLKREQGRILQVGQEFIDVDPPENQ